eukprot:TRINITY_DN83053_c0_g1_i1.p1 TRINITY_DN83053_c0_g1~~TRINITY_DN83053_c0_g1_i1.p1  ORF type:complete len:153 (-),score=15.15 TRINITY_DN83053_c0_g1_i1:117-575(-)
MASSQFPYDRRIGEFHSEPQLDTGPSVASLHMPAFNSTFTFWDTYGALPKMGREAPSAKGGLQNLHYQAMRSRGRQIHNAAKEARAQAGPTVARAIPGSGIYVPGQISENIVGFSSARTRTISLSIRRDRVEGRDTRLSPGVSPSRSMPQLL